MTNEIVKYLATGGDITLSKEIIKAQLVPPDSKITDQELGFFLKICEYQKLNPFLKEIYIVKYGAYPAAFIIGKETFLRRAKRDSSYKGHSVGISDDGKIAFAEVLVEGLEIPIKVEVEYDEYVQEKDGAPNKMWAKKPKTMLKKVALVQALREAFPDQCNEMYDESEIDKEEEIIDVVANEVKPAGSKSDQKKVEKKEPEKKAPESTPKAAKKTEGAKTSKTTGEVQECMTKIKNVTQTTGGDPQKPWTRFNIESVGGSLYTTFDKTFAKNAESIKGKDAEALLQYVVVDGKFYNLVDKTGLTLV
jgi:phage recombination protein Bet